MALTVVQLLPALEVGGVERGTIEVAAELVRRGHRAIVVSAGGRLVHQLTDSGAEHIAWPIGQKTLLGIKWVRRLRRVFGEADVVHARSRFPAWLGYFAWRGMAQSQRPAFVTTVHGPYSVNFYSAVMTRGERVIAISESIRDYVLRNYPKVAPERLLVIPRGVSPAQFPYGYQPDADWCNNFEQQVPASREKFLVTLPARITGWKGQQDFVRVIKRLKDSNVPVHGLCAGGAEQRQARFLASLKTEITAQGLDQDISLLGHRDDLRDILAHSAVVVSLTREPEAFGRTTLEALSLGTPVVGYAHGGTNEILATQFAQGLVPPGDITGAATLLKKFYLDPPQVPDAQHFTLQAMLDKTLAVYEEVTGN